MLVIAYSYIIPYEMHRVTYEKCIINRYIGLGTKWLRILSIDGLDTFFCFVNLFKAPNLLYVWLDDIVSILRIQ